MAFFKSFFVELLISFNKNLCLVWIKLAFLYDIGLARETIDWLEVLQYVQTVIFFLGQKSVFLKI